MKSSGHHLKRRFFPARCCFRVLPLLLACLAVCVAFAEDVEGSKNPKKSKGKEEQTDKADAANSGLKNFGQMIPQGSRSRGVRIPAFDGEGKPSSLIVADAMTRLDDLQLFGEKMTIHVYAEKKEEDMRIDLKTGTYNMDQQILSSTERSRVSRSDFQIEGDSMVYDTKTGQGKMVGNVEMVIFDADAAKSKMNISSGGAKKQAAEEPVPATTEPTATEPPPAAPTTNAKPPAPAPAVQKQSKSKTKKKK